MKASTSYAYQLTRQEHSHLKSHATRRQHLTSTSSSTKGPSYASEATATEEKIDFKKSLKEAEKVYKELESWNNENFTNVKGPTPTYPITMTTDIKDKWNEWMSLQKDTFTVLSVAEASLRSDAIASAGKIGMEPFMFDIWHKDKTADYLQNQAKTNPPPPASKVPSFKHIGDDTVPHKLYAGAITNMEMDWQADSIQNYSRNNESV
ncbi:uncharacterized protein L201_004464 [Kwoniella dendrophila CBS 6074]|uniref:Uncharacterized protein n=1 Tax=Kwoniella dendrophila CBS 6074 TaxID=1295534 RepID=A0AAX4JY83_9TREE